MIKFAVMCDNKNSFNICLHNDEIREQTRCAGKTVVLVRCDRTDAEDNARGSALADIVCAFLNTLTEEERKNLLAAEMFPPRN